MLGFQAVVVREVAAGEARADTGADAAKERAARPRESFSELEGAAAAIGGISSFAGLGCRRICSVWPLIQDDFIDGRCDRIASRRGSLRRSRHFGGEIEVHNVHRLDNLHINVGLMSQRRINCRIGDTSVLESSKPRLKQRSKMLCYVGGARIGAVEASRRSEPSKRVLVVSAALFALRSGDLCYDQEMIERPSPKPHDQSWCRGVPQ